MKKIRILPKALSALLAATVLSSAMMASADGTLIASFSTAQLKAASGIHPVDSEGYPELVPNLANNERHSIYGLFYKGLDAKKSYTVVANVRLNGYLHGDQGAAVTDDPARVFAIDPKVTDPTGLTNSQIIDPDNGYFNAGEIRKADAKYGAGSFIKYYTVIEPKKDYYSHLDKIDLELRIRYVANSTSQFMRLSVESIQLYEGNYKVPGGVKSAERSTTEGEDPEVDLSSKKPGQSVYNQMAGYKGTSKDFVSGNVSVASYDVDDDDTSYNSDDTYTGGTTGGSGTNEVVSTIPQSGDKGAGMFVGAMAGAAVIGGTAFAFGRRRKEKK